MGIYTKVDVRVVRLNVNRKCDKSGDDLRREVQHVVDVCEFRGYKAKHHREYTPAPRALRVSRGQTNSADHFVSYASKQTVFPEIDIRRSRLRPDP